MLKEYLAGNSFFISHAPDWQQAIRMAAQPLLEKGIITNEYIDAMIQNVLDNGNYIIILPKVAMPHARSEYGSKGVGMSFLRLLEPVMFPKNEPVELFFVLASNTPEGHLELLADLAEALSDSEVYETLLEIETEEELLTIFDKN